jgi:hypothetical protein
MISRLYNKHQGAIIAVVGSGPTAQDFTGKEDISIALNAAISLEIEFDYFAAFDLSLDGRTWFNKHRKSRIIGAGLAPVDSIVYPNLDDNLKQKIRGNELLETKYIELGIQPPKEPHVVFFYRRRCVPVFDRCPVEFSSVGNIAIVGGEAAITMGGSEIHFYGIDLNQRYYFYDPRKNLGTYGRNSVQFFNQLLEKSIQNNIKIKVKRGPNSAVTVGADLV